MTMAALTRNVGSLDRIVRIIAGVALIAFALYGPADIAWKWIGWIGVVPLVTALINWCPLYTILGIKT
jgi:sulfite exporter TauE/SafE